MKHTQRGRPRAKPSFDEHPVRTFLRLRGETEGDFAHELGITQGYFSHLLAFKRTPSAKLLLRLARLTGIPPDRLVKDGDGDGA